MRYIIYTYFFLGKSNKNGFRYHMTQQNIYQLQLSIKDYLLLIHTFMCMITFLRIIILNVQSHQIRILSAGLGMAWNRELLSWICHCLYLFSSENNKLAEYRGTPVVPHSLPSIFFSLNNLINSASLQCTALSYLQALAAAILHSCAFYSIHDYI